VAVAAAFAIPAAAEAAEDPVATAQAARAEDLMDRLYAGHGNPAAAAETEALLREAETLVGECLESGNYRTAEFVAGQVALHHPDRLDAERRYARILIARGEKGRAEKDLRTHLKERPSDCTAYGLLAGLLEGDGRYRDAMDVHEAHLREHGGEAGPLYSRASLALWGLRDPAAARLETARMREAADRPGTPPGTADFLRENAAGIEKAAGRLEGDRVVLRAAEAKVDGFLWGTLAAAVLALGLAGWATRRR
jgi:hypothetical protein